MPTDPEDYLWTFRVELILQVRRHEFNNPGDWDWSKLLGCSKQHVEVLATSEEPIRWRCPVCGWDVATNHCPDCGHARPE